MNYTFTPSLEHLTLAKIATVLWNQDDIKSLIANFYLPSLEREEKWQEIEDKVIEKVPQLPQPEPLKKEILGFIKPIGLQILKWKKYHRELLGASYIKRNLNRLFWTPQGTVDKKKTAEVLIKDESLDIVKRYNLACFYCLEDDIRELWGSMHQRKKAAFYNEGHPSFPRDLDKLIMFWTYYIKGETAKLDGLIKQIKEKEISPYQFVFEYAAVSGKKAATEYFLQKLTFRERDYSLIRTVGYVANRHYYSDFPEEHADVLCFLLSQMDKEQQIEVFKSYSLEVLRCLLYWPWQGHLMETANRMWDFLSGEHCYCFLSTMADKVKEGHKDYDYQKLFEQFWQQSLDAHKRYIINACAIGCLLLNLFKIRDERNIKLILKNATLIEKRKLIFGERGQDICCDLICGDKWDLLEFFIRDCISSKDEMKKFKEEFEEPITWYSSKKEFEKEKDKWNKFFQLLDDFIYGYSKRKNVAKDGSSPAKRLHSTEFVEVTHSMKK